MRGAWSVEKAGIGSGPSGGYRTHPPLPLQILLILIYVLRWLLYGCWEGIGGVCEFMIRREGRYFPRDWDWAPVGDHTLIPTPPPWNMGGNVDLVPNVLWCFLWMFWGNLGLRGACIHREGRYSPREWDWAPVVDYAIIPPSPLLNLLVKIKFIKYSMFMLQWFSSVLFVFFFQFFYKSNKEFG